MCEYCKTQAARNILYEKIGDCTPVNYCPVCGEALAICIGLDIVNSALKEMFMNSVVDENGKRLTMERQKSEPSKPPAPKQTPLSMAIDLENCDISKELELLKQHYDPKLHEARKAAAEHMKIFMKEKGYFDD